MTWVEGQHQRTFEVGVELEEVAEFLSDPSRLKECMVDLADAQEVDDQTWRWIREEVGAKNITFQPDYTVRYTRQGDVVVWESVGDGTMRSEGRAELEAIDEQTTRVDYREKLASDLPIPKLARKVFEPIVGREVKKGVNEFVDNVIDHLEAGEHREDDAS